MKRFGLACLLVCGALQATSVAVAAPQRGADRSAVTPAATLRQDMRKLWTDHVVWTRDYIIAAVGNQPDATAAANRSHPAWCRACR